MRSGAAPFLPHACTLSMNQITRSSLIPIQQKMVGEFLTLTLPGSMSSWTIPGFSNIDPSTPCHGANALHAGYGTQAQKG